MGGWFCALLILQNINLAFIWKEINPYPLLNVYENQHTAGHVSILWFNILRTKEKIFPALDWSCWPRTRNSWERFRPLLAGFSTQSRSALRIFLHSARIFLNLSIDIAAFWLLVQDHVDQERKQLKYALFGW